MHLTFYFAPSFCNKTTFLDTFIPQFLTFQVILKPELVD